MILATQSVVELAASEMLHVVHESCPTKIFLANPNMDRKLYAEVFQLNDTELELLESLVPKRDLLLKQPGHTKKLVLEVVPRWGDYPLRRVASVEVEDWLKTLKLAPSSRAKIRNLMSTVFRHAIRWGWIGQHENPITLVRVSAKRKRIPETLTAEEFRALFAILPNRERVIGTICATTGLRVCEVLGLKWEDIDFIEKTANVLRSFVDGSIGACKTEISQQPVPLDEIAIEGLMAWRSICPYGSSDDWIFGSERMFGRLPVWPDSLRSKILQPMARKAGITKRIGWHTFRHTYSSLLAETGNDVRVVQELMRHAKVSTTMEVYTHARMEKKRTAQSKAVDVLFNRTQPTEVVLVCPIFCTSWIVSVAQRAG